MRPTDGRMGEMSNSGGHLSHEGKMSDRTARRLTWGLVALAVTLLVSSLVIYAAGGSGVSLSGFIWAIALVFAGVGA